MNKRSPTPQDLDAIDRVIQRALSVDNTCSFFDIVHMLHVLLFFLREFDLRLNVAQAIQRAMNHLLEQANALEHDKEHLKELRDVGDNEVRRAITYPAPEPESESQPTSSVFGFN